MTDYLRGDPSEPYRGPERRRGVAGRAARDLARRQLAALSHAAGEMVTAVSVEQVTAIAVQAAVSAVGAEGGTVAVLAGRDLELVSTEHYSVILRRAFPRLALSAALPVCHAARTGERLLLGTREEATRRFPQVAVHQQLTDRAGVAIVSAAVLPLQVDRRLLGSLTVTWSQERLFSDADVELLDALAALVARALDRVEQALGHERALARANLLAGAGDLLTAGMDEEAVCQALVRLVAPGLAERAVVELAGGLTVAGPGTAAPSRSDDEPGAGPAEHGPGGAGPGPAGARPVVPPGLPLPAQPPPPQSEGSAGAQRSGDVGAGGLAAWAAASRCVVPLVAAGRRLGTLSALRTQAGPFTVPERELLRAVADRAALALDNAVQFAEQREISLALQQALLTEPPEPDRLHVVVRYQPASHAAVGGDWYDAVLTPDGATVLVVGDVVGHDARAAAEMGQLRGLLRAVAYTSGETPAGVLTRTEQAAAGLSVAALATAVVARVERSPDVPGAGRLLRWSSAGHLPPVLLRTDGSVRLLETEPELMLGVQDGAARSDHLLELADGDTLLLFTDGLVERRGASLRDGLALLLEHLGDLTGAPPDVLCDALLARVLRHGAEDDVALLAVRIHPQAGPRPPAAGPNLLPTQRQ